MATVTKSVLQRPTFAEKPLEVAKYTLFIHPGGSVLSALFSCFIASVAHYDVMSECCKPPPKMPLHSHTLSTTSFQPMLHIVVLQYSAY